MANLMIIAAITMLLYFKTYKYKKLIDDIVPRSGYLGTITNEFGHIPNEWYEHRRSWLASCTNIGTMFMAAVYIYLIWGIWPAVLFIVFPLNVSGVAWTTGNYYMTTVWTTLMTHLFLTWFNNPFLAVIAHVVNLETTLSAIPYTFIGMAYSPFGWLLIFPFLSFVFGKRFLTGIKKRKALHVNLGLKAGQIDASRAFVVVKVIAYYIVLSFWPSRLGFFHSCSRYLGRTAPDKHFWLSLLTCGLWLSIGISIDWRMSLWWFLMIGIYSQYTTMGMFVAERYTYSANVAFCVLISKILPESWLIAVAALWFYKSWEYCKTFKHNQAMFGASCAAHPDCSENFNNLASYYIERNEFHKAIEPLLISERLDKTPSFNVYANLSACYKGVGAFGKALYYAGLAAGVCPNDKVNEMKTEMLWLQQKVKLMNSHQKILRRTGII